MTKAFGPYSPIRQSGSTFYISGQVGVNPETKLTGSSITVQTKQVLENLASVLASAGLSVPELVKTTIFLTDMSNFAAVNGIYEKFFTPPYPARSTVAVKELPRIGGDNTILIEIEAIAFKESI